MDRIKVMRTELELKHKAERPRGWPRIRCFSKMRGGNWKGVKNERKKEEIGEFFFYWHIKGNKNYSRRREKRFWQEVLSESQRQSQSGGLFEPVIFWIHRPDISK
jgi:hypothetical protein